MKPVKKVIIVSLSRGLVGEPFVKHEADIGLRRLKEKGLEVSFSKHALKGIDYLADHPERRAADLLEAFRSDADMILCAVGGDDTYRLLPYLFGNDELKAALSNKIFLGFSDTTMNHLMLHKVGLPTYYGQAFLPDICELDKSMLSYTEYYFDELIKTGTISKITPSSVWYSSREDFSLNAIGTSLPTHKNEGFLLLQGNPVFEGEILGGCIDSMFDIFDGTRYADSPSLCSKYKLFPSLEDFKGKILLLETSEEKPDEVKFRKMIETLKDTGIFNVINGILVGKPADETYFDIYKRILVDVVSNPSLPIVVNINVGHALPRCIIPLGKKAKVDINKQEITFNS